MIDSNTILSLSLLPVAIVIFVIMEDERNSEGFTVFLFFMAIAVMGLSFYILP